MPNGFEYKKPLAAATREGFLFGVKMFSKIKNLLSKKCENCSMLNGSFGKNDPCSFCKRGDLNSKNFQDAEDFF